ncbi:MAG TPA: UPF0182 family protein [Candidatus Krumholzibacteria bacterium]|nr:UPF0182 family protein [Candidatus Krumholzibacteria bacterium]
MFPRFRPPRSRRGAPPRIIRYALAAFLLFIFLPGLVAPIASWLWFKDLGFARVYELSYTARLLLGAIAGLFALIFLRVNLSVALRGGVTGPRVVEVGKFDLVGTARRVLGPATWFIAVIIGIISSGAWLLVLRFLHPTAFGAVDPVFGRDVSYYVFTMPVITALLRLLTALTVMSLVMATFVHAFRRDINLIRGAASIEGRARMHIAVLVALLFVLTAVRLVFVRMPGLLYSNTGPLVGASYANLHGSLLGMRLAAVAALVGAVIVLVGARGPRLLRSIITATAIYAAVWIVAVGIYPALVNRFVVAPNELSKETPQLTRHIAATRRAWGLDSVVTRDLTGEARLTEKDIVGNRETVDNIRVWDRDPLLQTFGQLQEIRTYYDFISVDDDRYHIDGRYRQVLLSPRELNPRSLPTRTFINERLTFTHGMGLTLGPVNESTAEGLPVLFVKDLPPVSTVSMKVTRPEIYFGEMTNSWVVANTGQREFDYPSGDENVYTSYQGKGGIQVGSWPRRLLFAMYFRSMKVLLSSDITNQSRVMYIRNVLERAQTALPFLMFDSDPYLVIDDSGRLVWILDAYTRTTRYPYAQPLANGINYMRNSVKVVIDAYDGSTTAYIADPHDPLVQTLSKIFTGIFHPLDEMPVDLRAHLRYPEAMFRAQSDLYATYHMDEPATFYHREDQWQKPGPIPNEEQTHDPFLRHNIMRLPGEKNAEYIYMVPFTPRGKDNLASWMVARNDAPHYGELVVYRLPKQSLVYGPNQIVNRINQDTAISTLLTLWDQHGSDVVWGNLLVIPIEESLIYVQPIYLRAQGGRIPELKRVVVAYQNQVVMGETLEAAITLLFRGEAASASEVPAGTEAPLQTASVANLVRSASDIYQRAIEAQRAGDWARYGTELQRLGEVLKQLQSASAKP